MNTTLFDARRPRLLDLFCGAGGAATGYHRAGFEVVGIDIAPQPNYPFEFVQADALEWLRNANEKHTAVDFHAVHASPPCQFHTEMQSVAKTKDDHEELITPIRDLLKRTGLPYVIENVAGARSYMRDPVRLCGTALGLSVETHKGLMELRRHRYFETNWPLMVPPCNHQNRSIGLYGDHARYARRWAPDASDFTAADSLRYGREVMDMPWATWDGIREAIPPAYTELIGAQLSAILGQKAVAA